MTRSASAFMWVLREPGKGSNASNKGDWMERGCGGGRRMVGADGFCGMGCEGDGAKQRGGGGRLLENRESEASYLIFAAADIVEDITRRAGFVFPAVIFSWADCIATSRKGCVDVVGRGCPLSGGSGSRTNNSCAAADFAYDAGSW